MTRAELLQKLTELHAELERDIRLSQDRDQHMRASRNAATVASLVSFFEDTDDELPLPELQTG